MPDDTDSNRTAPEQSKSSALPNRKDSPAAPASASRLVALFGEPLLLPGENRTDFDSFCQAARDAIAPKNLIEEIFLHDFVHLAWDNLRLRRQKTGLLIAGAHKGLASLLRAFVSSHVADALAQYWARRDQEQIKRVEAILDAAQLNMEAVMAETLSVRLEEFERVDAMTMRNEARRIAILRELEAHRAVRGTTPVQQQARDDVITDERTNESTSQWFRSASGRQIALILGWARGPAPVLAKREVRKMPEDKAYRFQSHVIRHLRLRSTI
jgi:hypothetical protein